MKSFILPVLATVVLAPATSNAATLSRILADLTAAARFTSGSVIPDADDFDSATVLVNGLQSVEALVPAALPFPGVPNAVGTGFASSAGDAFGNYGVGVNTFSFIGADPAFEALAFGSYSETIANDTEETVTLGTSFFIPAPEIRFLGQIGDFLPPGAEARDITAEVSARIFTSVTRADGSIEDDLVFDYGMKAGRDPATGELGRVGLSPDAEGLEIEEAVGSFRFTLDEQDVEIDAVATLAPGDAVTIDFQYFAEGGNGFGETGFFAAIGDPFDIAEGGRFKITVTDDGVGPPPPSPVPLPAGLPLLAAGLGALGLLRCRRTSA